MPRVHRLLKLKPALLWILPALLLIFPQPAVVRADGSDNDYVPGEVVVMLSSTAALQAVATQYGFSPAPLGQFGSRPIYRLKITDGASAQQKVTTLKSDPQLRVIYAEPNYLAN